MKIFLKFKIMISRLIFGVSLFSVVLLLSCKNENCGNHIEPDNAILVFDVFYFDKDSGENLLVFDGFPLSYDSIEVIIERDGIPYRNNVFNISRSSISRNLGISMQLIYEQYPGKTDYFVMLKDYPTDTISINYQSNLITISLGDSLFYSNEICTPWQPNSIIISK